MGVASTRTRTEKVSVVQLMSLAPGQRYRKGLKRRKQHGSINSKVVGSYNVAGLRFNRAEAKK